MLVSQGVDRYVACYDLSEMAKKKSRRKGFPGSETWGAVPGRTKRAIAAIFFFLLGVLLILAALGAAGVVGEDTYRIFEYLLGVGYFLLPIVLLMVGASLLKEEPPAVPVLKGIAAVLFFATGLSIVHIATAKGGVVGSLIGNPVIAMFDVYGGLLLLGAVLIISMLLIFETGLPTGVFSWLKGLMGGTKMPKEKEPTIRGSLGEEEDESDEEDEDEDEEEEESDDDEEPAPEREERSPIPEPREQGEPALAKARLENYTPPPLSLLERDKGKPGVGDIKGNANLIKRTLANFGIIVELDEISIGPSVTRYAVKPAEGVRLSKIVSLQSNLELALAAHPVRIEAPIPGKSLVGIEVPNTAKVTVGLGSLLSADEFQGSGKPLLSALGRDISGTSHFGNIAKMPHLLIAGATGSGKSVTIHCLITSLLYRNGPQNLRFLMIDPKRVELTLYNKIPHLLSPVITDAKKAIMALRWAAKEMDRRYDILEAESVRDITSYHENVLRPGLEKLRKSGGEGEAPQAMPYIVIVIDELADIMQTYPRELEAAIVRLAQMSRAVGIHLMLSTQRPSVNVITGLIKANVPARIALQVASQIDSRTILDGSGAEKLLGAGDMLYLSGDMGKPLRLQSAFISETEVKKVVSFIAQNNEAELPALDLDAKESSGSSISLEGGSGGLDDEVDDDMYEEARAVVIEAGKASTSYIQRKLRVGYARAARIMDVLEERGVIGPADGAKPREVLVGKSENESSQEDES